MATEEQAGRVIHFLDGVNVYGRKIRLEISRHADINVGKRADDSNFSQHQQYNQVSRFTVLSKGASLNHVLRRRVGWVGSSKNFGKLF